MYTGVIILSYIQFKVNLILNLNFKLKTVKFLQMEVVENNNGRRKSKRKSRIEARKKLELEKNPPSS